MQSHALVVVESVRRPIFYAQCRHRNFVSQPNDEGCILGWQVLQYLLPHAKRIGMTARHVGIEHRIVHCIGINCLRATRHAAKQETA